MDSKWIETLARKLGEANVIPADRIPARFTEEPRGRFFARPALLVRPGSTQEVAATIRQCRAAGVSIVARGGGTGLVGGASVHSSVHCERDGVLLSLDRMHRVCAVDPDAAVITLEAGVTLSRAQTAAFEYQLSVPLSLASGGSATVGGILATNAGGNTTIRHGNARRMLLGLEAVLADGRVLDLMSTLRKDNTGYALGQLFVGSEGTLAIITRAALALVPGARQRMTVWCALTSPEAAVRLLRECRAHLGETLSAFELIPRLALDLVLDYLPGAEDPLARPHPWYVLLDADSAISGDWLEPACTRLFERALETGLIANAVFAQSGSKADALWRLREAISPAQKQIGASIKHDISVPIASIPAMIDSTLATVEREIPGIRPCVFGHVGDGNLHFNLSRPADWSDDAFMARETPINQIVFDAVDRLGGSIAAEHGIGRLRRDELARRANPVKLEALQRIKRALDPDNLLNPGKVVVAE